jgi:hypothetical protein
MSVARARMLRRCIRNKGAVCLRLWRGAAYLTSPTWISSRNALSGGSSLGEGAAMLMGDEGGLGDG